MLTVRGKKERLCSGVSRRDWLRIGGLGALGLSLPELIQGRAAQANLAGAPSSAKAKSCIVLFFLGGPPQHETWDPKPGAPVEIRGDLQPISSAVSGFQIGELMPQVAKLTDKISAMRAVSTGDNAHSTSGYAMSTGVAHRPLGVEGAKPGPPNDWPNTAAVVRRLRADKGGLPSAITLPETAANAAGKSMAPRIVWAPNQRKAASPPPTSPPPSFTHSAINPKRASTTHSTAPSPSAKGNR